MIVNRVYVIRGLSSKPKVPKLLKVLWKVFRELDLLGLWKDI